ncbi:MAG: maleylpyruvate isomerase family mycothiol-dependent enzyme [Acidimicrobiales bacterium]
MTSTSTPVGDVKPIDRTEMTEVAGVENRLMLNLLRTLREDDWSKPTDCPAWDVRALAAHVLGGMEGFASLGQFVHQMRAGAKAAGDGPFIDGMTAVQVRERATLSDAELIERVAAVGPRVARARGRVPGLFRLMPLKQEVGGVEETWRLGYLLDVILTRDTWMHRVDIARATGRPLVLSSGHDGRIVADVVAEWARRHGRPFTLHLEGPAGGTFTSGSGGETITIDAVEYCRILSGRATGAGLLTTEVPF